MHDAVRCSLVMAYDDYEANWNRQTDRQTGKPMCREAAPPKKTLASGVDGKEVLDQQLQEFPLYVFLVTLFCI